MKIYENKWSGLKRYFLKIYSDKRHAKGISILLYPNGRWKIAWEYYSPYDLKNDREHFPVVGNLNLKKLLIEAILNAIDKEAKDGKNSQE